MRKRAFTLVELAMVLVIIGILLSIGIGLFTVFIKQSKFKANKEIVQTACEAIKGYAQQNNNLPADLTSLGVKTIDPYNINLSYQPANGITSGDFCIQDATSWLTVYDRGTQKNNVAFIVYSFGENRKDDTDCSKTPNPCSQAVDFQIRDYGEATNSGTNYDDIVCYLDIYTLREIACPPLEITTNSLPEAIQYLSYDSGTINVSGGTIATCNISFSINGLTPDNANCKITGTPTVSGTFPVTIEITDTIGRTASKTLNLVIQSNPVKIETPTLPYGYENQSYQIALTASGATGSYTWTTNSWDLDNDGDADLVLSSSGILEANQDNPSDPATKVLDVPAGTYSITVQVCDTTYTSECTSRTYPFTVLSSSAGSGSGGGGGSCAAFSLVPSGGTYSAVIGNAFNLTISPTGGQSPYTPTTCTPTSCNGLTLSCSSNQATISGTPTSSGTCNFNVAYQDSCSTPQTASGSYTVNISCPALSLSANLPAVNLCDNYNGSITANGGTSPYTWTLTSGSLPLDVPFCNTTTNVCSLTGLVYDNPGSYNFGIQVQDGCSQLTGGSYSISVNNTNMTGISGYDCSTTGITFNNAAGRDIYYSTQSGSVNCKKIRRNRSITVLPGDKYYFYRDKNCNNLKCTFTFCDLWNVEKSNNVSDCNVYITNIDTCSLVDF